MFILYLLIINSVRSIHKFGQKCANISVESEGRGGK
jgi:hypothetical protein